MAIFRLIQQNKKRFLDLLLLADEQEDMIDRYLECGELWTLDDNGVKAVCVVAGVGDGTLEIKNLAVVPNFQRKGYGKAMIEFIAERYKNYSRLRVGTGASPLTLPFYRSCGFRETGVIPNFFTDNYDHPIVEGDIVMKEMILLERSLLNH